MLGVHSAHGQIGCGVLVNFIDFEGLCALIFVFFKFDILNLSSLLLTVHGFEKCLLALLGF